MRQVASLAFALSMLATGLAAGDRPLTEARSDNRRFTLQIESEAALERGDPRHRASPEPDNQPATPASPEPAADPDETATSTQHTEPQPAAASRPRGVMATLRIRQPGEREGAVLWRAPLVNPVAPVHALIRDDGAFLVTLDDYAHGGARHAVVVYDATSGALLREFTLQELLTDKRDWENVRERDGHVEWLAGADMRFARDEDDLRIRLRWGTELTIPLRQDPGHELAQLNPDSPEDRLPELLQMIMGAEGQAAHEAGEAVAQFLAQQLAQVELDGAADTRLRELLAAMADAEPQAPAWAGNSAAAGQPVPAPNPANPVSYVEFINDQIGQGDPAAIDAVQTAADSFVAWEGDEALFRAAMSGDATALADPQILAWLEANRSAMDALRSARALDYKGMPLQVPADGMIWEALLPHLAAVRGTARAITLEGHRRAAAGDAQGAAEEFLAVARIGAQQSHGPLLIDNLVGLTVHALGTQALLDLYASDAGNLDYDALAGRVRQEVQPTRPVAEVMQFERAAMLDVLQRTYELNPDSGNYRVSEAGLARFHQQSTPEPLDAAMLGLQLGAIGYEKAVAGVNAYFDDLSEAMMHPSGPQGAAMLDVAEATRDASPLGGTVIGNMMPSLGRAHFVAQRADTTRRATLLVTEIHRYKQQSGAYPASLSEFDPELAADPLSGGAFVYRVSEDGSFMLYSLGANAADDGGVHDHRGQSGDLVFWPRPPKP